MSTNPFNICPSCVHVMTCVLTEFKDKVWSCSEYDEAPTENITVKNPKLKCQAELV